MERRYFIKAYDYWFGYTSAQIELMIADQPIVVYDKQEKNKMSKTEADAIADEWKSKRSNRAEGEKISLSEFFSGENVKTIKNIKDL